MEEMSEEIEKLLEKITEEKVVIYHEVNGKTVEIHPLADVVESAIYAKNPTFTYISEQSTYGYMHAEVYVLGKVAIIREQWFPSSGFSWSETRLTLLVLKSP